MHAVPPTDPTPPTDAAPRNAARRAWLRKGAVAATPVLASLASAPVHAAGVCVLPSGFISVATFNSRHPGAMTCVGNRGPNYWAATPAAWTGPTLPSTPFLTVFISPEGGMTPAETMAAVLTGAYSLLAKYSIAAYLNAELGTPGFPLLPAQVVAVWRHFRGGPTTALIPPSWTELDAVTWLQSLMDP